MPLEVLDRELRERAAAGEEEAYGELLRRYFPAAYDFAVRLLGEAGEARHVLSEVMRGLVSDPSLLASGESFRALIFAGTMRLALERLRGRSGLASEAIVLTAPINEAFCRSGLAGVNGEAADHGVAILIWQVAGSLDRRQFALLDLTLRQRLSVAEVAYILGLSTQAVEATVRRMELAVEGAMAAVVLGLRGRRWCHDLDVLMSDEDSARVSDTTRRRIEDHIAACNLCTQTVTRFGSLLALYRSFLPVPPPPGLRAALMGPVAELISTQNAASAERGGSLPRMGGRRMPVVSPTGRIEPGRGGLVVEGKIATPNRHEGVRLPRFRAARMPLQGQPGVVDDSAYAYSYSPEEPRRGENQRTFYYLLGGIAILGILGLAVLLYISRDDGAPEQVAVAGSATNQEPAEPILSLNVDQLDFGADEAERVLTLTTTADETTTWSISSDQPWLTVTPDAGSIEPGETLAVSVAVNRETLAEGQQSGTLSLASSEEQTEIRVQLIVPGTGPTISDERLGAPQDPETTAPYIYQAGCESVEIDGVTLTTAFGVTALIEDPSGIASVNLVYVVGEDEPISAPMEESSSGRWEGSVPPINRSGPIVYHIEATDNAQNTSTSAPVTVELRSCAGEEDNPGG
ncbi:MAG: hypothetical protein WEB00_06445 [Dehalococcoidia bacterium]